MAPASSGSKAFFTNVDTGSVFFVQFNPKEFKLDEKANWKASDEHENDVPLLTYEKGEPTVVTMDLVFDSTDDGSDVYKKYVEPLRDFLTADVQVSDNEGDKMKRPPFCQFTWSSFTFHCVVEKISATCLMFKPDGTALRAKVQVGLKERVRNVNGGGSDSVTLSAVGSMFSGAAGKAVTYTIQHGDTLSSVAAKTKAKARDIAIANDIQDPINLPPGRKLVIPADSKLADILAQQGRKKQDGNWQGPPTGPGPRARGGYLGGAPSTFDEVVGLDYDVDPGGIAAQYMSFSKMDYGVRGDSESSLGTAGKGIGLGADKKSALAGFFRNDATPDEEGAAKTALGYDVRGDSEGSMGTAGKGIGLGTDKKSALAEFFRNEATPEEQAAAKAALGYDVRGDSEGAFGSAGQGIGLGVDKDSEGTFGDAGKHFAGGDFGESGLAEHFRNDATPDEQGSGPTAQGYGVRGDSQGTFGDAGKHFAGGNFGDSGLAGHFRNDATPDGEGSGPSAQGYGGYGDSEGTFGTSGAGGGGGGVRGGSDGTFGTSGQGGGQGGAGFGVHAGGQGVGGAHGAGAGHLGGKLGEIRQGAMDGSGVGGGAGGAGDAGAGSYGGGGSEGTFGSSGRGAGEGGGGGNLRDMLAAHGRVGDQTASGGAGGTVGGGGGGAEGMSYGTHTGGLASEGGGGAQGGDGAHLKDLLAAHGRIDGQAEGAGGGEGAGVGADVAAAGGGGRRAALKDAMAGKGGADFKKAFEAAKQVADAKKQGE